MDLVGTSRKELLTNIHKRMDSNCIDFNNIDSEESQEALALCDELLMEQYIENGTMSISDIKGSIHKRKVFPIFFLVLPFKMMVWILCLKHCHSICLPNHTLMYLVLEFLKCPGTNKVKD